MIFWSNPKLILQTETMTNLLHKIGEESLNKWIKTLKTQDPKQMVSLYHKDAVLLPTLDSSLRNTHAKLNNILNHF